MPSAAFGTRDDDLAALIQRVAEDDHCAVSELYGTPSRIIYGLVLRILKNAEAAEEVLLDVYTQVWRQASLYDRARGAPLAWMTTIARSRAINRLRSGNLELQRIEALEKDSTPVATGGTPEDLLALTERRRLVRSALDLLSTEQRESIELAYYGGLTHSEIAARLGQPLGTIKTRIRLGMMKLRDALKSILENER